MFATTHPVEAAVGAAEPAGKTKTCQVVPVGFVHPATADTSVIEPIVKAVGLGHVTSEEYDQLVDPSKMIG